SGVGCGASTSSRRQRSIRKLCEVDSSEAVTPCQRSMKASVAALLAAGARLISSGTGAPCPARPAMPQAYGKQRPDNACRPHPRHGPAGTRSRSHLDILKILGLFIATALAEIIGVYLPFLWLRQERPASLTVP